MYEIVWQYDEVNPYADVKPPDANGAIRMLIEGNQTFARFFAPHSIPGETTRHIVRVSSQDVGVSGKPGEAPAQEPFAAFISCADARVPVELIFGQQANDLFVVRVAGNVLGSECLGSLDYAVDHLRTVRLVGVLGHTGCGAVTAAVDAYLSPAGYLGVAANFPLQAIVGSLMAPARGAAFALSSVYGESVTGRPGYRQALIETTVILNAALAAAVLTHNFHESLSHRLQVAYGVYDLRNRSVGLPGPDGQWQAGLFRPPTDEAGFEAFGRRLVESRMIHAFLESDPPPAGH